MVRLWFSRPIVALQYIADCTSQIEVPNVILKLRELYLWAIVFNVKVANSTESRLGDRAVDAATRAMVRDLLFPIMPGAFSRLDP